MDEMSDADPPVGDRIDVASAELTHVSLSPPSSTPPSPPSRSVSAMTARGDAPIPTVSLNDDEPDAEAELGVQDAAGAVPHPSVESYTPFVQLVDRSFSRVVKLANARKYKTLRDACRDAQVAATRGSEHAYAEAVPRTLTAIRAGCLSGKSAAVEVCLDVVHKVIEYGFVGAVIANVAENSFVMDRGDPEMLVDLVDLVCGCIETSDETIYLRIVQTLLTAVKSTGRGLHHGALLATVRTTYNIYLNAKGASVRPTAKTALVQILNLVFSRVEKEGTDAVAQKTEDDQVVTDERHKIAITGDAKDVNEEEMNEYLSVVQKDAYLLFRALCKLSSKDIQEDAGPESIPLRSKLLSLELLQGAIAESGHIFRTEERFIYVFRQYLIPTLLSNCMSSSMPVVDVSLEIFETLVLRDVLRPILKREIASIFVTVIFRFLESPASGFPRRSRALRVINNICLDAQCLADIFVNYDCDLASSNIFEKIINVLSNASQKDTGFMDEKYERELRRSSLQAISSAVSSLRSWAGDLSSKVSGQLSQNGDSPMPGQSVDDADVADISGSRNEAMVALPTSRMQPSKNYAEATESDTARFQETLRYKRLMEQATSLFNNKPKKGIEFIFEHQLMERDPQKVADFLKRAEGIDATMVGEYLGEGTEFNLEVMHAYTDNQDFTRLAFDQAIRQYLSGFRLPGEAQKIDRIMEKFASRFCECNPDVFANADTGYVLAYSVIMLNTDAHNPQVKSKMTKEDFLRNNRGIDDGKDLDPLMMGDLYDRIIGDEIRLTDGVKDSKHDSAVASGATSGQAGAVLMDAAARAEAFRIESERLLSQTKTLFGQKDGSSNDYVYFSAKNAHHALLMFESCWPAVLAANSVALERAPPVDDEIVPVCLTCFQDSIAVSSSFGMDTEKESFLSSLAKFTYLQRVGDMRAKNVACVRTILSVATSEGNNLGKDWTTIVRAVSQLEQIRAAASSQPDQYLLSASVLPEINIAGQAKTLAQESGASFRFVAASVSSISRESSLNFRKSIAGEEIDGSALAVARAIEGTEIDRLFMNSANLASNAIADLAQALCTVALEELNEKPVARVFCIQKIIEISYYNMDARTRIQWTKIWEIFSPFFATAMCHKSTSVSMFCIDSLRQLASKFLEKDELSNYAFQKTFLKPFETGFSKANTSVIRELILSCISQIVLARASNIKSGWKPLFVVLSMAAEDKSEAIMNFGFQIVDMILRKYFSKIDDVFIDAVAGVSSYAKNPISSAVCLAAIDHLSVRSAVLLAEGKAFEAAKPTVTVGQNAGGEIEADGYFSDEVPGHVSAWFPLLTGLANAVGDHREMVRTAASDGLFSVLNEHGGRFNTGMWRLIFQGVLSPIFDDVEHLPGGDRHANQDVEKSNTEWAASTGAQSLRNLVSVSIVHFDRVRPLLSEIMQLIRSWIVQENEQIARDGMAAMDHLMEKGEEGFLPEDWDIIMQGILDLVRETLPTEIMTKPGTVSPDPEEVANSENTKAKTERKDPNMDFKVVRTKCVMQLLLIQTVQNIVERSYIKLQTSQIIALAEALERSFSFAHGFNLDVELRFSLWKAGFMNQVPNLFKQETTGMVTFLRLLHILYLDSYKDPLSSGLVEERLLSFSENILRSFIVSNNNLREKPEEQRELTALIPVACSVLHGFLQRTDEMFGKHLPRFFDVFMELIEVESRDVRMSISDVIRFRMGSRLGLEGKEFRPEVEYPGAIKVHILKIDGMSGKDVVTKALMQIPGVYRVKVEHQKQQVHAYGAVQDDVVLSAVSSSRLGRQASLIKRSESTVSLGRSNSLNAMLPSNVGGAAAGRVPAIRRRLSALENSDDSGITTELELVADTGQLNGQPESTSEIKPQDET